MGLFDFLKSTRSSGMSANQRVSDSTDFFSKNISKINEYTKKMRECEGAAYEMQDLNVRLALFQKAVEHLNEFKEFCYSKPGGKEYFAEEYERSDAEVLPGVTIENNYFERNYNHQKYINYTVVPKIIELSSSEGILQKDIYKEFQLNPKELQIILREMEFEKLITKEKSGNSYLIKATGRTL